MSYFSLFEKHREQRQTELFQPLFAFLTCLQLSGLDQLKLGWGGIQPGSLIWAAGTQLLEPPLLPPTVHISRNLGLNKGIPI